MINHELTILVYPSTVVLGVNACFVSISAEGRGFETRRQLFLLNGRPRRAKKEETNLETDEKKARPQNERPSTRGASALGKTLVSILSS